MIEGASAAPNDDKMQQQSEEEPFHPCPSFSTYSSETLAEIAARVINELRFDPQNDNDDPLFQPWAEEEEEENDFTITDQNDDRHNPNDNYNENANDGEADFSFAFVSRDANTSPVSADDIFYNGQIRPMYMYPLFNINNNNNNSNAPLNDAVSSGSIINNVPNNSSRNETVRRRLPLRKLMFEEREETGTSCSSSEADDSVDLEGVPEGTYCVWNPNAAVVRDRKKSSSTGSSNSKRWKLRELLLRSLSEGGNKGKKNNNSTSSNDDEIDNDKKRRFVFGVPGKRTSKVAAAAKTASGDGYGGAAAAEREGKSGGRKKSVLPYSRPELVGVFANVNGLGRNLHPF